MLFVVATPIGNLEDITLRALRVLREADAIACEDTRVTRKLLTHADIHKPLTSVHEHTKPESVAWLIDRIRMGESIAYVTDAGTPGVNDPGGKLVQAAYEAGVAIVPVPGPSALAAAISVCGFPMNTFTYVGFIPRKKGRETLFREMARRQEPTIFFESTHRMEKTLEQLALFLDATREFFLGREFTKIHETLYRGTLESVRRSLSATSTKGEFVAILGPKPYV